MAKAIKRIIKNGSEFQFDPKKTDAFCKKLSVQEQCVTLWDTLFDEACFYCYKNMSSVAVDTDAVRNMLKTHGGFYRNGQIVKPSPAWLSRQELAEMSGWGEH